MKKGTWAVRMGILLATISLGLLFFWLIGFATHDIRTIQGPDFQKVLKRSWGSESQERLDSVSAEIAELNREIRARSEEQTLKASGAKNMEATLEQLNRQMSLAQSDEERQRINQTLRGFLDFQKEYQALLGVINNLTLKRQVLERERDEAIKEMQVRSEEARKEWAKEDARHRVWLAVLELALLLPLLALAVVALFRAKGSLPFRLWLALACAVLVRLFFTLHEYLPTRWFKYVAVIAIIVVVLRLLVYLVALATRPRPARLLLQYRQAYEKYLCPICEYPVRVGPLKFLYWTRKSAGKVLVGMQKRPFQGLSEPYNCPDCGESLFETCAECGHIRHSLMEHCEHCGARKKMNFTE